jgi:hypothetical protein
MNTESGMEYKNGGMRIRARSQRGEGALDQLGFVAYDSDE